MILRNIKYDFLAVLIGKLLQVIIMIISIKISTSLLNPNELGKVYLFMAIYTFFVLLLISPFGQYINRNTHKWHSNGLLLDIIKIYIIYVLIISSLSVAIGFVLNSLNMLQDINLYTFLILLFLFILFLTLNQTILPTLNMLFYRLSFIILTVATSLGIVIFGYLFIKMFGNTAENWLFGTVLSNAIFMIVGFFILKNKLNKNTFGALYVIRRITIKNFKSMLYFVLPLSIATFFMWLQNSGYRILIEHNIGLSFLGFLGTGFSISAQIASTLESIVMEYLYPIYYKKITSQKIEDRKKAIDNLINKVLPIYFMLAIFVSFFAKYIVEILVDKKYYSVYAFVVIGIWVEFFRMSTNLFGNISKSEMNTRKFMVPYIIGSLISIFLVYLASLNDDYEIYLPISLLMGGFLTMMAMCIFMKKLIAFSINFKLLFLSFLISIPYIGIYFFTFKTNLLLNLLIVGSFGIYFIGTIYFIYKRGLLNGNS